MGLCGSRGEQTRIVLSPGVQAEDKEQRYDHGAHGRQMYRNALPGEGFPDTERLTHRQEKGHGTTIAATEVRSGGCRIEMTRP